MLLIMPGSDGSCCLGTYTCVATNCMGGVTSSAALLGIDDGSLVGRRGSRDAGDARSGASAAATAAAAALPDVQTPDISDGNLKPFSLSTIQEERTSQLMSPEAPTTAIEDLDHHQESEAATTTTLREEEEETTEAVAPKLATTAVVEADVEQEENKDNFNENNEQFSVSVGKADENGDVSISIGNQEMTLSLYQTPDLSERDARHICEMFAEELAESVNESGYVELPPLRFMRETARASNINMEAIIIDVDEEGLEEYESLRRAMENVDDLQTEADMEDVSIAEWNDEPLNIRKDNSL